MNVHSQPTATLRNDPNTSNAKQQATQLQRQTQSIDEVTTEQPIQKMKAINKDIVNARVSEYQFQASKHQFTADEAVGSLVDVRV